MTIKAKLITSCIVTAAVVVTLVISGYLGTEKLGRLQAEVAQLTSNSREISEASANETKLYQVIADAEINRELGQTAKDWLVVKQEALKDADDVNKLAQTEQEKAWAAASQSATVEVINLFESQMMPLLKSSEMMTPAIRELDGKIDAPVKRIGENMSKFNEALKKEAKDADARFKQVRANMLSVSLIIGLIGLALVVAISLTALGRVMKPLTNQLQLLRDLAEGEGDLTKRLDDASKDEFGGIGRWFNLFVAKLQGTVGEVAGTSLQVAAAARQLHATADQIASGTDRVALQAGTVATACEEMAATSSDIAQNCQRAAGSAKHASASAQSGGIVVKETIDGMLRLASQVKGAARTVEDLGARSDQIGAIVGTIEDIADQTNLLALNAAIEAARAGEQGRGFAVVADEVRALAERTTKATREIGEMIKTIQNETKGAVAAMEEGVKEVERGTTASVKSGQALDDILQQVNDVEMQIDQIATAVEEQTATTAEITNNIQQMTDEVHNAAREAAETAEASGQLSHLAEALQRVVRQFKLTA
jgi:methyl-accepting chemotaxis protein